MNKKLFLGSLAMTVALPVMVAPVQAQEVGAEVSQDFNDVPKTHSAYTEITTMRNQGIISGYPDNTYMPAQSISRVHTVALIVRSLDLKPVREGKEFKDVPKLNPYYNDVQTVYRAGIFDGKPDGTFGVNDNLTRAQMAKVLVNAFKLDIQKGYIFDDVYADNWAKNYIATLYVYGITTGSNGKFMPNQSVTRAQYATFLYRALHPDKSPEPNKPLTSTPPIVKPEPKQGTVWILDDALKGSSLSVDHIQKLRDVIKQGVALTSDDILKLGDVLKPTVKPGDRLTQGNVPLPDIGKDAGKIIVGNNGTKYITMSDGTLKVFLENSTNLVPEEAPMPKGWTPSVIEEYEKIIKETVFETLDNRSTNVIFGTLRIGYPIINEPGFGESIAQHLKKNDSNRTTEQFVADMNKAIKTGELVVAPDNTYAIYAEYGKNGGYGITIAGW